MNSRAKGKRIENEFMKLLLNRKFLVNPPVPGTKWNRQTDHWGGRFDVEAISTKHTEMTFLFQIATRWKTGETRRHIEDFPMSYARRVYMVRRKDGQSFEMKEYMGNGSWKDWDTAEFLLTYGA